MVNIQRVCGVLLFFLVTTEVVFSQGVPQSIPPTTNTPASPLVLTAEEVSALDLFLRRWEEFSGKIKRFDIGFTTYNHNIGETPFSTYGVFQYVAPNKMSFHIQGEWVSSTEKSDGSRQEKMIVDERAIYLYDYAKKVVKEVPIPLEMQGKTIGTGPLPLIFGAKADDMKSRYWMRLVTPEQVARSQAWLEVFPRWSDDASEFQRVILVVNRETMVPIGMKVVDINGKSYVDYAFDAKSCKINNRLDEVLGPLRNLLPETPLGWKREVASPMSAAPTGAPPQVAAIPSITASQTPAPPQQPPRSVNLYTP